MRTLGVWDTPIKTRLREAQTAIPFTADTALMLPGPECLDIEHMLNEGMLARNSRGYAVEMDAEYSQQMADRMAELGLGAPEWDCLHGRVEDVEVELPLQFAYLDFCTAPSADICHWMIQQLNDQMTDGSYLSVTWLRNYRRNGFMNDFVRGNHLFRGTDFISTTRTMCEYTGFDLSPTCLILVALTRLCMPTCILEPSWIEPYRGDGGADMLGAAYRVKQLGERTVPQKLLKRLGY